MGVFLFYNITCNHFYKYYLKNKKGENKNEKTH